MNPKDGEEHRARSRATVREVAAEAGVSVATVSYALRGLRRVPEATRERVRAAAERVGYRFEARVSEVMSRLRRGGTDAVRERVAFLTEYRREDGGNLAWLEEMIAGAEARAKTLGCELERFRYHDPRRSDARLVSMLKARGVRGVILLPLHPCAEPELDPSGLELVAVGAALHGYPAHRVGRDFWQSWLGAVERLRARGHRRLGFVATAEKDRRLGEQIRGVSLVAQSHAARGEQVPPLIVDTLTQEVFKKWMRRHRPDVILSEHTGLVRWLEQGGWKVPKDVGFCSLTWSPETPRLAGIDPDFRRIGSAAAAMLIHALTVADTERGAHDTLLVEGRWREGPSVRARTA